MISQSLIPNTIISQYADDLCVLNRASKPVFAKIKAEWAAEELINYYKEWGLKCNVTRTEAIIFTTKIHQFTNLQLGGDNNKQQKKIYYLGIKLDKILSMKTHVNEASLEAKRAAFALNKIMNRHSRVDESAKLLIIEGNLESGIS